MALVELAGVRRVIAAVPEHSAEEATKVRVGSIRTAITGPYAAVAVTVVIWASAFPAIRVALHSFSPWALGSARLTVASAAMVAVACAFGLRLPQPRDFAAIALVGLTGMAGYQIFLNLGEVTVASGTANLLVNSSPIFTAILGRIFIGERIGAKGIFGIGIACTGAIIVALSTAVGYRFDGRALFILAAALCQAVYFVLQKPLLKKYSSVEITAYGSWAGTIMLCPLLPYAVGTAASAGPASLASVAWLAIACSAGGYVLWAFALNRLPAWQAASALYAGPAIAFVIGWLLLREIPSSLTLLGGLVAICGVVIVNLAHRQVGQQPRQSLK